MKLYAIFGNPVAHSISPTIHNYAFMHLRFPGCYTKILVQDGSKLKEKFLELQLQGVNITVPHKEWAYKLADEVFGIAKEVEAVNTWYNKDGKIHAYNTDAPGFYESIKEYEFSNILILGAGGTAKAIALYLKEQGYDPQILNRSEKRLAFFKERGFSCYTWDEFSVQKYDLIINTTSAGLKDNSLPAPQDILLPLMKQAKYAVDVIYNKLTPFLALAKDLGLTYKDGTDMLLYQGVLAFEIFTDFAYEKEYIIKLMKKSLQL
ncbi:shikimate dehydrogenase [Nitratiruptor tergarcus]|uniref:Shikimate dehydrogenase (NADP(+)) n=1 Tax=Nitratiruptor tergarcus DSM 16512 TaxID=1069081 RepID=A0A1W1WSQ4_9BACT|nr:shikimate dehydrogenase [Nitratiruptor tergarcus]SMC09358.1 shikimate dehydrogenase [Nitratiruptor tergarcus DSM 16512]